MLSLQTFGGGQFGPLKDAFANRALAVEKWTFAFRTMLWLQNGDDLSIFATPKAFEHDFQRGLILIVLSLGKNGHLASRLRCGCRMEPICQFHPHLTTHSTRSFILQQFRREDMVPSPSGVTIRLKAFVHRLDRIVSRSPVRFQLIRSILSLSIRRVE